MSAPTADGRAAAIVCSEEFVKKHNLQVNYLHIVLSTHVCIYVHMCMHVYMYVFLYYNA